MASENKWFHEAWVLHSPRRNHCWHAETLKKLKQSRAYGQTAPPCLNVQLDDERRRGVAELQVRCAFPAQPAPHDANGRAWLKQSFPPSCRFSPPLPSPRLPPRGCALNGTLRHNLQLFVCVFSPRDVKHTVKYKTNSQVFIFHRFSVVTFLFCVSLLRVFHGTLCQTSTNGMAEVTSRPAAPDHSTQLV